MKKQFIVTLDESVGMFNLQTQKSGFSRFELIGILDTVLRKERDELNHDVTPTKQSTGPMPDDTLSRLFGKTRKNPAYKKEKKSLGKKR